MNINCPKCHRQVAKEDRRCKTDNRIKTAEGVDMLYRRNEAPRLKCPCGAVVILAKGSL